MHIHIVEQTYSINMTQDELASLLSHFIIFLKNNEIKFEDDELEFDVPLAVEYLHKEFGLEGNPLQLIIKVADMLEKKYDVACRHGDIDWDK